MSDLLSPKEQAAVDAVFATPYTAVPPMTARGVTHVVTHAEGWVIERGQPYDTRRVVGSTACGKTDLLMDRLDGGFPPCGTCSRTAHAHLLDSSPNQPIQPSDGDDG